MHRTTRRIAVGLALLAAVALLVPTAATQFLPTQPSDDLGNQVHLQPSTGANGAYSYLDDGELVIDVSSSNPTEDVEGVNPGTVTHLEDVFVVHYNGSEYAEVWLTHEGEGLTFTAAGHPVDSRATAITLGPNETDAVGLIVDTTDGDAVENVDEFTVHARAAEPESTTGGSDDIAPGGRLGGSERTPRGPTGDGVEQTTTAPPVTTTDSSAAPPADVPADAPLEGSPTTTGESSEDEVTTTAPEERSPTLGLFGEGAGVVSGSTLGMATALLLVALAMVLGGRRRD